MNAVELFDLAERLGQRGEQAIAFINDTRNLARAERLAEREEAEEPGKKQKEPGKKLRDRDSMNWPWLSYKETKDLEKATR